MVSNDRHEEFSTFSMFRASQFEAFQKDLKKFSVKNNKRKLHRITNKVVNVVNLLLSLV